jgi:hypothetical protein
MLKMQFCKLNRKIETLEVLDQLNSISVGLGLFLLSKSPGGLCMKLSEEAVKARREYQRQWREQNKKRVNEYMKNWRENNRDKVQNYNESYWMKKARESVVGGD